MEFGKEMLKYKKIYIIIVLIIGGLVMLGILRTMCDYQYYSTYCKDYYLVVAKTDILSYEKLLEMNGEPKAVWEGEKPDFDDYIHLDFGDGRIFVFQKMPNDPRFCRVEITNSNYRFGKKKIGIGTEKGMIEQAYKNSYRGLYKDKADGGYYVEDGYIEIEFIFDEKEKVKKMIIGDAEIYHGLSGWKKIRKNKR